MSNLARKCVGLGYCRKSLALAEATGRAIDALVYQLYGLNEEEICIVEGK